MQQVLIVIHLLIVVALVAVILLQRSEQGALSGLGGGGAGGLGGLMSGRGQANLLTRTTAILAAAFFATSLLLAIISGNSSVPKSVIDQATTGQSAPAKGTDAPAAPASGGVLDQLKQLEGQPKPAQ
jgi:preprotein translocase subunit SecG